MTDNQTTDPYVAANAESVRAFEEHGKSRTRERLAAAEDVIAAALNAGVRFGVRCGCTACDAAVAKWLLRIQAALSDQSGDWRRNRKLAGDIANGRD